MNCQEVQKLLSDLLDKSLDDEPTPELEAHLAGCQACSAEMSSLGECQRLVASLPAVEPPSGFTTRVMTQVRETAQRPPLWERLFLPLRIKIPLQATALVLIAVLAAYIYQKEPLQPESEVSFQPESSLKKREEPGPSTPSATPARTAPFKTKQTTEENKARVQEFKDSLQSKEPLESGKQQKPIAGDRLAASGAGRSQEQIHSSGALSPSPPQEKSSAASAAAPSRLEPASPATGTRTKEALEEVPQAAKENVAKDPAAAGKPLMPPQAQARSATSSLNALRSSTTLVVRPPDHEVAIRLKEAGRDDKAVVGDRSASSITKTERRSLISQEEANNLEQAREQAIQTHQSQTVWVSIPLNQYGLLEKELADLGNIESSTPDRKSDAAGDSSDRLRIKVTLLPPLRSGNLLPAEPSNR